MIELRIQSKQHGEHMLTEYSAKQNEFSTPAEIAHMNEIVNAVINHLAGKGMSGQAATNFPSE